MNRTVLAAVLIFFGGAPQSGHSAPLAPSALTFEDCLTEAKIHNADLGVAAEAVKNSEAAHKAAFSGFLPQISASGGYLRGNTQNSGGAGVQIVSSTDILQYSLGLSATQNLFSGFKDVGKVRETAANLEVTQAALATAKAALSYNLKSAFYSLVYGYEYVRLTATIAERRRGNSRLVALRFEGGRENKGSSLLSKASVAQAEYDHAQAMRAVRLSQRKLASILGRDETDPLEVTGTLPHPTLDLNRPNFSELAVATPDHRGAVAQTKVAQAQKQEIAAQFLPSVDVNASAGKQGSDFLPQNQRWSLGVTISLPIFPGGSNIFNLEGAHANERKAEMNRRSVDYSLRTKLEDAYNSLADAIGQNRVANEYLEAARARAIIARGRYTTGLMTFDDWDLIENDLITREKNALQSLRDAVIAEAAWEQARGTGVIP